MDDPISVVAFDLGYPSPSAIDVEVLDAGGRPGHFGLLGMRERAEKIRAQVRIWSKAGAGTEIDLRVPAEVAYRRPQIVFHGTRRLAAGWQSVASYLSLLARR